jgi:hypothetical protein
MQKSAAADRSILAHTMMLEGARALVLAVDIRNLTKSKRWRKAF